MRAVGVARDVARRELLRVRRVSGAMPGLDVATEGLARERTGRTLAQIRVEPASGGDAIMVPVERNASELERGGGGVVAAAEAPAYGVEGLRRRLEVTGVALGARASEELGRGSRRRCGGHRRSGGALGRRIRQRGRSGARRLGRRARRRRRRARRRRRRRRRRDRRRDVRVGKVRGRAVERAQRRRACLA